MTNTSSQVTPPKQNPVVGALVLVVKGLIPLLILGAGAAAVYAMIKTAPQPQKAPHQRRARLVTIVEAERTPHRVRVEATGRILPAREVTLNPQVGGEIIEISPNLEPGGHFEAGAMVVKIEPADYELAAKMRQAELTQMEAERVMEQASQDVARREYEVLGEALNPEEKALVMREPQLAAATADVEAARAMLADAQLDLDRTTVTAPFDAQVVEKYVDLGTRLNAQAPVVRLVGTDTYWVELKVEQSNLRWIEFPEGERPGSAVVLKQPKVWGPDAHREGRVIRLLPDLSAEGSMARVLVAVDDPLALLPENEGLPTLLVGQFVTAEIEGATLDGVVVVDRALLRSGDWVWIMNAENKLEVRPVEIAYRGLAYVLVQGGIEDGERIVTTDIATVADGMELRLDGAEDGISAPDATATEGGGAAS